VSQRIGLFCHERSPGDRRSNNHQRFQSVKQLKQFNTIRFRAHLSTFTSTNVIRCRLHDHAADCYIVKSIFFVLLHFLWKTTRLRDDRRIKFATR
jgi:hypothetical protein